MAKYATPANEGDALPNLLGLTTRADIDAAEFAGVFRTEVAFTTALTIDTRFSVAYLLDLHRQAFDHLYDFAGELRTVNLSKGGFLFPSPQFLPQTMQAFEQDFLQPLPNAYVLVEALRRDIARVHAELLFIHPFREGNGRTARIFANLMAVRHGYQPLRFGAFSANTAGFDRYVYAVQRAAGSDYGPMQAIIDAAWSGHF